MSRDNDLEARLQALESELAELKTVHQAAEDMRRQVEREPFGLGRLKDVKRKAGYPGEEDDE